MRKVTHLYAFWKSIPVEYMMMMGALVMACDNIQVISKCVCAVSVHLGVTRLNQYTGLMSKVTCHM